MGLNYKLTWVHRGATGRWRKLYKGRWLSYSGDGGKVSSYPIAWQRFQEDKARIDQELVANNPLLNWIERLQDYLLKTYHDSLSLRQAWQILQDYKPIAKSLSPKDLEDELEFSPLATIQKGLKLKVSALLKGATRIDDVGKPYLDPGSIPQPGELTLEHLLDLQNRIAKAKEDRGEPYTKQSAEELQEILKPVPQFVIKAPKNPESTPPWEKKSTAPDAKTLKLMVDKFYDSKPFKPKRLNQIRIKLEYLCDYFGDDIEVGNITSPMLTDFHASITAKIVAQKWQPETAKGQTQVVGQFFDWLFESELIEEKPRLLQGKSFTFELDAKEPNPATIEECQQILLAANNRMRLYALLMLNCGFTQVDISDLKQSEVDWKQGIITRKRSKTSTNKSGKIPKISYQLWPETFELLKAHRSKDPELVLVSAKGTPLVQERLVGRAKTSKTDLIRSAWKLLQRKTKIKVSPKRLRKTGANELNKHKVFKMFCYDLLGDVPSGVAEKHYIQFDQAGFAKALAWLRTRILPKELMRDKPSKRRL